jgi:CRISPR-associated protein Csm5
MSQSFLKPYRLEIRTLSPVHIGSGKKLGTIDFVLKNQNVCVIDDTKLFEWIASQPNSEKLSLMLADTIKQGQLKPFINQNFPNNLNEIIAYTVPSQGSPREILSFIRTESHHPYIPGSSIKGALRSAVLRGKTISDAELQKLAADAIRSGAKQEISKTNSDLIEAKVFVAANVEARKRSNYDLNRLLTVRDTTAQIKVEVMKVQFLSVDRNGSLTWKQKNFSPVPISLYIEAIPKNQVWQHQIVWQTHLLNQQASKLDFAKIEDTMVFLAEYCHLTSQNLLEQEHNFYRRHREPELTKWYENALSKLAKMDATSFILPLGWGTGYDAKTITDLLGEETYQIVVDTYKNTWGLGKPGRNRNATWLGISDSPKSRKVVVYPDQTLEPLGWVEARIIAPDQQDTDWLSTERARLASKQPSLVQISPPIQGNHRPNTPAQDQNGKKQTITTEKQPLIRSFKTLPKIGDRFEGVVFDANSREILLEIPDLDPDQTAYAVIARSSVSNWLRAAYGSRVPCKVTAIIEESKSYWRVQCELD